MDFNSENLTSKILKKDPTFDSFVKIVNGKVMPITLDDLQQHITNIRLTQNVPKDVKEIFEISRKLYLFGYFYYRFFTVSQHYAFLALESALRNKHQELLNKDERGLKKVIDVLTQRGIIPKKEKFLYDAGRQLRNTLSHLTQTKVFMPSASILSTVAEQINKIYEPSRPKD